MRIICRFDPPVLNLAAKLLRGLCRNIGMLYISARARSRRVRRGRGHHGEIPSFQKPREYENPVNSSSAKKFTGFSYSLGFRSSRVSGFTDFRIPSRTGDSRASRSYARRTISGRVSACCRDLVVTTHGKKFTGFS